MLLNKCLKATFRNFLTKPAYKFSIVRIDGGRTLKFPYNFNGYDVTIQNKLSESYQEVLDDVFETDTKEGFKYAYSSTLEALLQKDFEYFRDICEPRLYSEVERGLLNLDELGLDLEGRNFSEEKIKVAIDSFALIYGVQHIREENFPAKSYDTKEYSLNGVDLKLFTSKAYDPIYDKKLQPMIQIGCLFYSSKDILLREKGGEVVAGDDSNGYHRIVFELASESDEPAGAKFLDNILGSPSGMFGAMGILLSNKKMVEFIRGLFGVNEAVWKIVDIDNHLKGNPHI